MPMNGFVKREIKERFNDENLISKVPRMMDDVLPIARENASRRFRR